MEKVSVRDTHSKLGALKRFIVLYRFWQIPLFHEMLYHSATFFSIFHLKFALTFREISFSSIGIVKSLGTTEL